MRVVQSAQGERSKLPRSRTGRHDELPEEPTSVLELRAPASPDASAAPLMPTPIPTALPPDVERRLAELAGVAPMAALEQPAAEPLEARAAASAGGAPADFAARVLQVSERVALGALLLLSICALVASRVGGSLRVHSLPLAGWGLASAACAVALAALVKDPDAAAVMSASRRRGIGGVLMALLLVSVSGVVTSADGLAGPAWVVFVPVVVVCGAVLGPSLGLSIGGLAAAGLYTAAGLSHTLDPAGIGRLLVLLPSLPAIGWASGALAGAALDAATTARAQREALESDVAHLTRLLEEVADGDLSQIPSLDAPADQATATLTVAFADTLLSLRRLVRQLHGVADQLATNATDLAGTASQHVAAVEEQASAVAQTTSTIEELAAAATTIADTSLRVARYAGSTRRDVDAGAAAVAASSEAMTAIGARVSELGDRTRRLDERVARIAVSAQQIDDLGRQTTMLAVNAAIEAARTGEAGRGFGTVAEEVATLAARAREATAGISRIVGELHAEVGATATVSQEGAEAVAQGLIRQRAVERALTTISHMVDQTTAAAHDITGATRQQRMASDGVVSAMHLVSTASDQARVATQRHATAAERLRDLAGTVRAGVGRFRVG